MQFSIFHSIAESNINSLVQLLNDGLKPKEHYSLVSVDDLPDNLVLLTASDGKDFVLNIVDQDGNVPDGYCVNWRTSQLIMLEFGNEIPEPVIRQRIAEINKDLLDKGYDWDYIEKFWNDIFKKREE
ncbi:MAG TPA: hypothetical protein VKX31_02220 [Brumimicrobium sp.]|nr:hypothetical protein [Brumimicrobium sp.]